MGFMGYVGVKYIMTRTERCRGGERSVLSGNFHVVEIILQGWLW